MDKHAVYNAVSGVIGLALAIVFFMILFGKIDIVGMLENGGRGDAIAIFETRQVNGADAKEHVVKFLKSSADTLDSKLKGAAAKLNMDVIDKESLFVHSSRSHNNGHCVRLGVIDSDFTDQIDRIFLFVDGDGLIEVENDC